MISTLFESTAFAQAQANPAAPSPLEMFGLPLAMLVLMYFLILRPQQKKIKAQQELMKTLKAGDEVVTTGGIIARVQSVSDTFVTLDSGSNTRFKVQKNHITALSPKAAPAAK